MIVCAQLLSLNPKLFKVDKLGGPGNKASLKFVCVCVCVCVRDDACMHTCDSVCMGWLGVCIHNNNVCVYNVMSDVGCVKVRYITIGFIKQDSC